ncbi:AMP-binding protein [Bradyrhizobium sp. AS23.2]|uniref:AMP-dependent synthetase/ligase n=1 Tax=Bradyrhizobium sp. AS23.2 TaxID=1680155 RepID=UPI00093D6EBF|nr:AMP-binding protein [Bradyrhizobium sp. AS23.2]OKO83099.1 fatty-acid--CoA ligase [Bradyrhizobium sp. AS23.2]
MVDDAPYEVDGCNTVPRLFWSRVQQRGDGVAMREKEFGIWNPITWREYGERSKLAGLGLKSLGLSRGDVVSIISENLPEWLYTDMGTLGVGGITNGIYTTDSTKQVQYIVNDSRTKFFFAEDEEQLDKILSSRDNCPSLIKIIVYDMEGLQRFRDDQVISFDELLRLGAEYDRSHPGVWERELELANPDDLAVLIYTSGTTGPAKGAMIAHRNIIFHIANADVFCESQPGDELLSFLPLCHIAERKFSVFYPLKTGAVINFIESLDAVPENAREVSPTWFFAVPRIWEKFYSDVTIKMSDATFVGKAAYGAAIAIGKARARRSLAGENIPWHLTAAFWIADKLILHNIKVYLGLRRTRILGTGAAPISPDLIGWYFALGLEMREIYGQTENTGISTVMPRRKKLGTVGTAIPGTQVKLSSQNEILVRGPHVFLGYLNNEAKTAETVVDGWLHTGDVGEIDGDGYVRITDRMKDIIVTAGGKNITPSEIENHLKFSPFISDAVVIGDRRKYLSCLVMIDHDNVVKYAQDRAVPFTNYASLCAAKEVRDLIDGEIAKVNKNFARVETIKRFALIDQLLTAEDDELTPTMKLKRKFVNEKYKSLIDAMYEEKH